MSQFVMASVNISLPESMKTFIESEAAREGYSTVSEYVRAIIREAQQRKKGQLAEAGAAQLQALNTLRRKAKKLPVKRAGDGFSNRDHDKLIYNP